MGAKKGEPRGGEEGGWVTIYVGLDNTGEVAIGWGSVINTDLYKTFALILQKI